MCYRSLDRIVPGYGPYYRVVYQVLPGRGHVLLGRVDHDLPGPGTYCTRPSTM